MFRYISQVDAPVVPGTARREPEVRCGRATRRTDQGDGARGAVALLGVCLLALNLMALIGLLARDRSVLLAILFYLRLLPLGGAAIAFDLTRRGRGIGKPRFLLAAIGLITVACSGWEMIGRGPEVPTTPRARPKGEVRLLHWNVLWGGGRRRNQARWGAIVDDIQRRRPDVVVLSEAPPEP